MLQLEFWSATFSPADSLERIRHIFDIWCWQRCLTAQFIQGKLCYISSLPKHCHWSTEAVVQCTFWWSLPFLGIPQICRIQLYNLCTMQIVQLYSLIRSDRNIYLTTVWKGSYFVFWVPFLFYRVPIFRALDFNYFFPFGMVSIFVGTNSVLHLKHILNLPLVTCQISSIAILGPYFGFRGSLFC